MLQSERPSRGRRANESGKAQKESFRPRCGAIISVDDRSIFTRVFANVNSLPISAWAGQEVNTPEIEISEGPQLGAICGPSGARSSASFDCASIVQSRS